MTAITYVFPQLYVPKFLVSAHKGYRKMTQDIQQRVKIPAAVTQGIIVALFTVIATFSFAAVSGVWSKANDAAQTSKDVAALTAAMIDMKASLEAQRKYNEEHYASKEETSRIERNQEKLHDETLLAQKQFDEYEKTSSVTFAEILAELKAMQAPLTRRR